jgi:uncharacterized LabA/DUF88 family protein
MDNMTSRPSHPGFPKYVALRLGHIPVTQVQWQLRQDSLKALVRARREWVSTRDVDFRLDIRQKGVDMRIGLDIASRV